MHSKDSQCLPSYQQQKPKPVCALHTKSEFVKWYFAALIRIKSQFRFTKKKREKASARLPQQAVHSDNKFGCLLTHHPSMQGKSLYGHAILDGPTCSSPEISRTWPQDFEGFVPQTHLDCITK